MEISRRQQEEQLERLERQFYEFLLAYGENFHNRSLMERERQCILESVRNTIMTFKMEDELLLRLFEKLEYVLEYDEKVKAVDITYRLSA